MVFIIENIEEISIEWMNILNLRKVFKNVSQLFIDSILTKFDFAHVKRSDTGDGIAWVDHSGSFSLGL